jgi:predicted acylesterase/phospholipase RssA
MIRRRAIVRCLALLLAAPLALITSCGPGYRNHPMNDLRIDLDHRALNNNPRAESFLLPIITPGQEDRPRAKVVQHEVLTTNGYFVGLAISGGGSRSANFAAACMFQLQRIDFLRYVQCISSVSGGSLVSTYYCSAPDSQWNPLTVQQKFSTSFETTVIDKILLPWNFLGLLIGTVNRSDMLANEFQNTLFTRDGRALTFADLRRDRPRLLLNCTDMQSGRPFLFDNSNFDLINSDLNRYPLAVAVTASSAVPAILEPITLRDYSTDFPQFQHLVDGAVVDNLGVQTLVNSYAAESESAENPYPNGAILVVIDSGTPSNLRLGSKARLGGVENLLEGLSLSSAVLLNRTGNATLSDVLVQGALGSYTITDLRNFIEQLRRDHYVEIKDRGGRLVRVVHLSLSQVSELGGADFANSINAISTKFDIKPQEAFNLYRSAEILFRARFDARLVPLVHELQRHATSSPTSK